MSLSADNYKFMQATALEAISANYTIQIKDDITSAVEVVARGPVILEPSYLSNEVITSYYYYRPGEGNSLYVRP